MKTETLKRANQIQGEIERLLEVSSDLCSKIDSYRADDKVKQIYKNIVIKAFREKIDKLKDDFDKL